VARPWRARLSALARAGRGHQNERSLGKKPAGTYTVRIGAHNNKKSSPDQTTLLLDNVRLETRTSDCPDGQICGRVYPGGCRPCDEQDAQGNCTKQCPPSELRCGTPFSGSHQGASVACANDALFDGIPGELCEQVELCADPGADGNSDPNDGDGADLTPETFDPEIVFGDPAIPDPTYPDDPPCDNPPCSVGPSHNWCHYDVEDNLPDKPVPPDTKRGNTDDGSQILSFNFDPNLDLDFKATPLPFGESDFELNAEASFRAGVSLRSGQRRGACRSWTSKPCSTRAAAGRRPWARTFGCSTSTFCRIRRSTTRLSGAPAIRLLFPRSRRSTKLPAKRRSSPTSARPIG
jgi:hypothetical protein